MADLAKGDRAVGFSTLELDTMREVLDTKDPVACRHLTAARRSAQAKIMAVGSFDG